MNIPETRAMLARPMWQRCLRRSRGARLSAPTEDEKRDAIAVIRDIVLTDRTLSVDAMMLREAERLLDEHGR